MLTFSAALVKRNECERTKKDDLVSACGRCCGLSGRSSFRALWKHGDHFGQVVNAVIRPDAADQRHIVVRELRIPRTLGCILAGAAFSAAGSLMQGVTRNPLADSGLLGINAGASFALALCLAFLPGLGFTGVVIFSFLGASVSMLAVYGLMSMRHRKLEPVRLVLAGSAVSIFLSSLSQAVSIFFQIGHDLTFWTADGAAGIRSRQLLLAGPVIVSGLVAAVLLSGRVSMLSPGGCRERPGAGSGAFPFPLSSYCSAACGRRRGPYRACCLRRSGSPCGPLFYRSGLSGGHSLFHGGGRFLYAHCRYYFPYHQCACGNAYWSDFFAYRGAVFHLDCKKGGQRL